MAKSIVNDDANASVILSGITSQDLKVKLRVYARSLVASQVKASHHDSRVLYTGMCDLSNHHDEILMPASITEDAINNVMDSLSRDVFTIQIQILIKINTRVFKRSVRSEL